MNQYCVPDFEMEDEDSIPTSSFLARKMKSTQNRNQDELFELIWQNGQIVMQSQNRKNLKKPSQKFQTEDAVTPGVQQTCNQIQSSATAEEEPAHELFMQEDEMASWLDYPLDDSFEGDFCSDLLNPTPSSRINQFSVDRRPEANSTLQLRSPISPTRCTDSNSFAKLHNFKHFSRAYAKGESQPSIPHMDARESTVADPNDTPSAGQGSRVSTGARESVRHNPAVTSYSRCSGAASKPSVKTPTEDRKRKAIQVEDNESHSEDVESESVDVKKQVRGSARRVRSAEVHNLSERRRRDRINEKMKALQELIPHCDKSDKASMLDEAIEYLKSLQLQVQMMSMGFGMAPMRFPGVQQYMSPMGMGMGTIMNQSMLPFPSHLLASSIPTPASPPHMGPKLPMPAVQDPPAPTSDSSKTSVMNKSDPALNSTGTETLNQQRMQNFCYPYPHYVGFLQMQVPPPQIQAITHPGTGKEVQTHENHQSGIF